MIERLLRSVPTKTFVRWECSVLLVASALFIAVGPKRIDIYVGLALLFTVYIGLSAGYIRQHIWAQQPVRASQAWRQTMLLTIVAVLIFFIWGWQQGNRINGLTWLLTVAVYTPWAWIQQVLFQFYCLGRLRILLPQIPMVWLCGVNGVLYGLVHAPQWDIVLLTVPAGFAWSYIYSRHRALLPLAVSHACLGASYYLAVRGDELLQRWLMLPGFMT